ncbi:MAG: Ku protein [Candidatus Dormibacteria bacterium]
MPRSMWKGAVSFGMVSIPVRMYLATESKSVSFRSLCPCHQQPIKQKRHCSVTDDVLEWKDVLKGYELSKDRYVIIEESDLDNLPLATARTLDITEFVDSNEIADDLYLKNAYYLEPEKAGLKAFYLLKEALGESGRVAVGKIAFHDREHMATLRPHGKGVVVNTLHWPDEIRDMAELNLPEDEIKIDQREMAMAKMLIDNLTEEFDPQRYHDEYREALQRVAEAKAEGQTIEVAEDAPAPRVMDLMAALKASVEASKRGGKAAASDEQQPARPKVVKGKKAPATAAAEKPRRRVAKAS